VSVTHDLGVCGTCGLDAPAMRAALAARDEVIETLQEDLANVERELRGKRAQIKRMKAEQDAALKKDPLYPLAMNVLEHWKKEVSPGARELGGKRLENVLARATARKRQMPEEAIEEELKRSIDGYALKPFVVNGKRSHVGTQEDWYADAELIFRSDKHVAAGLRIAARADDLRSAIANTNPSGQGETVAGSDGQLSPIGQAAVRMAQKGFMVFPCKPQDKAPATRNGLLDAKRDVSVIEAAWRQHPFLNLAVRTGVESGIVVLDLDGDDGWDSLHALEDQHGELPTTASVTTPRGGQHFYFQHPGVEIRNSAGLLGAGLDVRGDGGYVLAPPSVGANGNSYEVDEEAKIAPLPSWLKREMVQRQTKMDEALAGGAIETLMTTGATSGNRNERLLRAIGSLINKHSAAETLTLALGLNARFCEPPLAGKEVEKIVKSVVRMRGREAA
jgi:hypothetical protein